MKLKHDKLLSNFACYGFNSNLRPSIKGFSAGAALAIYAAEEVGPP